MTDTIQKPQPSCLEELECYYHKADGTCTFRKHVKAMLSVFQDEFHRGANCIVNLADTYDLPCNDLDEKGRQRGIGNLFADLGIMH